MNEPLRGGVMAAAGSALGEQWVFLPIGALVVDFVLTVRRSRGASIPAHCRVAALTAWSVINDLTA